MSIRSDSKSTVGRLQGTSEIRDILFAQNLRNTKETSGKYGIYSRLLDHLESTRSISGFLLEQLRRKEKE